MTFTEMPTEQTTAATDVLLAVAAMSGSLLTYRAGKISHPKKAKIWAWAFILLAFAAMTGAIAHGIQMPARLNYILWQPLNLALGLTISLFVVGVVYDLTRGQLPKFILPLLLTTGVLFYLVTLIFPGIFLVFILYEAAAMFFSLTVYLVLSVRRQLKGAFLMTSGILTTILAAAAQASETIRFTCIWEFDHNGLFHLIQLAGLIFLVAGLRIGYLHPHAE